MNNTSGGAWWTRATPLFRSILCSAACSYLLLKCFKFRYSHLYVLYYYFHFAYNERFENGLQTHFYRLLFNIYYKRRRMTTMRYFVAFLVYNATDYINYIINYNQ